MKTPVIHSPRSAFWFFNGPLCAAFLLAGAAAARGQSTDAFNKDLSRSTVTRMPAFNVDEDASVKTHTLFMGADIAINFDRDNYSVKDVTGSNWIIQIDGREHVVSAKQAPQNLKITPSLKLTDTSVTIVGFRKYQAYSFGNDPSVLLTKGLNHSAAMGADLQAVANNAQARQDTLQNGALAGAAVLAGSDDQFSANAILTKAAFAYSDTHAGIGAFGPSPFAPTTNTNTTGGVIYAPTERGFGHMQSEAQALQVGTAQTASRADTSQAEMGNEATGKIVTGGLDALDIAFDIRSGKMLQNPYVVTMTRFRSPNSKPGMVQNMVYAKSLHPIDEHVEHIHFVEEGFPYGYEILDFQMHVYNRGVEVASNIASDRVELTRDEAFEYVKMEYMGAHKKDTLPATPAMGKLPKDLAALLAEGKYRNSFYVKVSKEGTADQVFADSECRQKINDPYLEAIADHIRFKPALDKGQPVTGVAEINLNRLAM